MAEEERGCPTDQEQAAPTPSPTMLARLAVTLLLADDVHAHFVGRMVQDALTEASAAGWVRRAEAFEHAAPQPGDYRGRASTQELEGRRDRCLSTAAACRRHAALLADCAPEPVGAEVYEHLGVAA